MALELGLDRSTLHHYFPSRDELITAAMEHVMNAYRAQVDRLREEKSIYIVGSGRINVAGMNEKNIETVCREILSVL